MKYPRSVIFVSFYIQFVMQSFYFSACKIIVHIFGLVSEKKFVLPKNPFKIFSKNWSFWIITFFFSSLWFLSVWWQQNFFFSGLFEFHISFPFICKFKLLVPGNSVVLKYLSFGENNNLNITLDNIKFLSRWKVQTSYFVLFCQLAILCLYRFYYVNNL